ncbi:uncharacterized protein PV07_03525 [Cladophialophora immunda]|uniref:Clr5 domain-containing protein n=1 Tax=Cladophialophora immunda TaxID=569365 RepID=A0A0D2D898_9EURO|nr:uncharacterized protein PV07_03525 [Cladophialophora immunda]KIW31939.1 hypothetical protein PV07_03525 [Cladophialophora immunda]OQU98326.1 hypothetical protein CLAIMM_04128 [Cladophialophora immunda]
MAAMEGTSSPSLESLLSLWPIASTLSQYLPVGDLITLARLNVALRAVLHAFEIPEITSMPKDSCFVRTELNIGRHATPYWQSLKGRSPFECSSQIHTKGPEPKPCRYCSRPICDACIVRSSFARGHENTFQNRVRHLCKDCWRSGNPSRTQRFPLDGPSESTAKRKWYDPEDSTRDYCICTLKDDGWLCIECKDSQNWEAISSADTECHGQDCKALLDADDKDRRRICLWCNKGLPRQIGGTTRYYWNQKMIEARARNAASRQADLEEYNRRRLKLMRMSRREMRGDEAVKDDPDADLPQFVRHLDTVNYRSYMSESAAPSGDAVYGSKRGYWRYTREFLLEMRGRCGQVPVPRQLNAPDITEDGGLRFARTNAEMTEDFSSLARAVPRMPGDRLRQWCTFKVLVLEHLLVEKLSYQTTQQTMRDEYGFDASVEEYHTVMRVWNTQDAIKEHRRKSLDREGEEAMKSKGRSLAKHVREIMDRDTVLLAEDGGDLRPQSSPESSEADPGDYELTSWRRGSGTSADQGQQPSNSDGEAESALKRKMRQDRESSRAQAYAQVSSSPARSRSKLVSQPSNEVDDQSNDDTPVTSAPTPTTQVAHAEGVLVDPSFDGEVSSPPHREEDDEDEPPPYTANGWVWP